MDTTLLLAAAGLLLGSVILSRGVEHLIHRLGARPANPADRSGGLRDVGDRLAQWQREWSSKREK